MQQYKIDILRFSDLLSKYTGISKSKIDKFLINNRINNIFDHPTALDINKAQLSKIIELKELYGLYEALKTAQNAQYKIKTPDDAKNYLKAIFFNKSDKERLICVFLDTKNNVIASKVHTEGSVNQSAVYPREIAKDALLYDACSVMVAHNHPSGDVIPSSEDISITGRISTALNAVQIKLLDHIIVGNEKAYSFEENGISPGNSIGISSVFEKIKKQYETSWPAISCVSDATASEIHELNTKYGRTLSINEIKDMYKAAGKALDVSAISHKKDEFDILQNIIDGLKKASLRYQMIIKTQNKNAVIYEYEI